MNVLKLKSFIDGIAVYEYQPEGNGKFGLLEVNAENMQGNILQKAEADFENEYYAKKALRMIIEFLNKKNFPMEYTQAWY